MRTDSRLRPFVVAPLAVLALTLGACSDPTPSPSDPDRGPSATEDPESPDPEETAPTRTRRESPDEPERTVAGYYVGDTERAGPRLYREFQRVEGEALAAARGRCCTGTPLDHDYRTALGRRTAHLRVVRRRGHLRDRRPGRAHPARRHVRAEAQAAVEQVVYTMQAAVQERAPVQFRTADNPIDQVFGIPTSEPVANGPMLDVLSHVNLTSPEQGAVVDDGTLEVSGVGNSFEANLGWEVRQGDEVVDEGFATMAGWMEPKLFPFEAEVDVCDLAARRLHVLGHHRRPRPAAPRASAR